jgi:F0F1-type ATP synthase assembly protein I
VLFYNATGPRMSKDSKWQPPAAGGLAFMLVALVVIFTAVGYWLDRWLQTSPWLMVAGVFVGAGLGFTYLVFISMGSSRNGDRKRGGRKEDGPDENGS